MKFVVIDIETTGTNPNDHKIIEFGAVIEDATNVLPIEQLPTFKCIVKQKYGNYNGSAYAINMNQRIFEILASYDSAKTLEEKEKIKQEHNIIESEDLVKTFVAWVKENYLINNSSKTVCVKNMNIAGKNYATFDKLFIDKVDYYNEIKYSRRIIDPAILFVDWVNDDELPNLDTCLKRAGINRQVTHNALEDAIDVLLCLRTKYNEKN
jgi:oligoribonuclease (3'-5' exoribonuclease)